MAIEGYGEYDDTVYYKGIFEPVTDSNLKTADIILQNKVSGCFKIEADSRRSLAPINENREIKPLMVKIGYSQKDKDGKEKKVEVTIDTRDGPKQDESSSSKDSSKAAGKKDKDKGK